MLTITPEQYDAMRASAAAGFRQRLRDRLGGSDAAVDALIDHAIAHAPALGLVSEQDVAALVLVTCRDAASMAARRYSDAALALLADDGRPAAARLEDYRAWAGAQLAGPAPLGTPPPPDPLATFGTQPVGDPAQSCPSLRVGGRVEPGRAAGVAHGANDGSGADNRAAEDGSDGPQAPTPDHWIEIELVGEDGLPIPGEEYVLVLPDGETRSGHLDQEGFARADGIVGGGCKVMFPRLDREVWDRIETRPAKA